MPPFATYVAGATYRFIYIGVRSNNFLAAIATGGATQWLDAVIRDGLLDKSDLAALEASAVVRRLSQIPMTERVIYRCPIRSHHLL